MHTNQRGRRFDFALYSALLAFAATMVWRSVSPDSLANIAFRASGAIVGLLFIGPVLVSTVAYVLEKVRITRKP